MLPGRYLVVLWCALISSSPVWGGPTPRIGVVNRDGAVARSGPGQDYYAADALRKGDRLEVYRVDEGGWCAVRPPAGSFSWVLAENLRMTDNPRVAEVTGDDVLAFVGSRVRKERDVVQVRLNRGELVEVVGQDELPSPETGRSQTWYRILPPAGEYRWVHLEFVDREEQAVSPSRADIAASGAASPAIAAGGQQPTPNTVAAAAGGTTRPADRTPSTPAPRPAGVDVASNGAVPRRAPISTVVEWKPLPPGTLRQRAAFMAALQRDATPKVSAAAAETVAPREGIKIIENFVSGEPAPRILGHHDASPIPADSLAAASAGPDAASNVIATSATGESRSLAEELAELDVQFSLMVAKPSTQWQLEPLMLRAQQIAESATTPQVHGQARALLEKMVQFARLQPGASPLGQVLPPTAANTPGFPTNVPHAGLQTPPPVAGGAAGRPSNMAGGGLPRLLNAIDSLMPAEPTPNNAPAGRSGTPMHAAAESAPPLLQAVSAQTPETAPPPPGDLTWGTSAEPTVRLPQSPAAAGSPVGSGPANGAPSPWQLTRANPSRPATGSGAPAAGGTAEDVFDRVKDTLLYPFGAGTPSSGAGGLETTSYDGRGWLVPVVSRKGRRFAQTNYMPPFALTDAEGNVLQFVTPAPGVNLHRYLKQEIGVFGQQHPLEHLTEPHITASRVVMLDRHRR